MNWNELTGIDEAGPPSQVPEAWKQIRIYLCAIIIRWDSTLITGIRISWFNELDYWSRKGNYLSSIERKGVW